MLNSNILNKLRSIAGVINARMLAYYSGIQNIVYSLLIRNRVW